MKKKAMLIGSLVVITCVIIAFGTSCSSSIHSEEIVYVLDWDMVDIRELILNVYSPQSEWVFNNERAIWRNRMSNRAHTEIFHLPL